jgi:hypothetical protein
MNFLKAQKYGELVTVFDHNISPTYLQRCQGDLDQKLENITSDDYLIPVGPPALIAYAGYVWLSSVPKMKMLVWDRESNDYYVVEITDEHN